MIFQGGGGSAPPIPPLDPHLIDLTREASPSSILSAIIVSDLLSVEESLYLDLFYSEDMSVSAQFDDLRVNCLERNPCLRPICLSAFSGAPCFVQLPVVPELQRAALHNVYFQGRPSPSGLVHLHSTF